MCASLACAGAFRNRSLFYLCEGVVSPCIAGTLGARNLEAGVVSLIVMKLISVLKFRNRYFEITPLFVIAYLTYFAICSTNFSTLLSLSTLKIHLTYFSERVVVSKRHHLKSFSSETHDKHMFSFTGSSLAGVCTLSERVITIEIAPSVLRIGFGIKWQVVALPIAKQVHGWQIEVTAGSSGQGDGAVVAVSLLCYFFY